MTGGWDFVAAAYLAAYFALLGYGLALSYRWRQQASQSPGSEEALR